MIETDIRDGGDCGENEMRYYVIALIVLAICYTRHEPTPVALDAAIQGTLARGDLDAAIRGTLARGDTVEFVCDGDPNREWANPW